MKPSPVAPGIPLTTGIPPPKHRGVPTGYLTRREFQIVTSLAKGQSDKETAEELHISTKTVETHMQTIRLKMGTASRVLIALAFERNEIPHDRRTPRKHQ